MVQQYKEKRFVMQISEDLKVILDKIRENVNHHTWGAEPELGYFKASKILANRIKTAKLY